MALRGRSGSMGSNFPPSLWHLVGRMEMGSHEPARMLWCRWFIHVISSSQRVERPASVPFHTSGGGRVTPSMGRPLVRSQTPAFYMLTCPWARSWTTNSLQGCIIGVRRYKPINILVQKPCVVTKAVNTSLYTGYKLAQLVTEGTLCHLWLLFCRSRSRMGKWILDVPHGYDFSSPSSSAPLFILLAAQPRLCGVYPAEWGTAFISSRAHFCNAIPHGTTTESGLGVSFLSSVTDTQSRQTKLAIAAEPLEKHYS